MELLAESHLKFRKAFELAQSAKADERDSKDLQHMQRPRNLYNCDCCGGPHARSDCRFKNVICHGEEKKGHLVYSTWGQAQEGGAHHGDFTSKNVELERKLMRVLL